MLLDQELQSLRNMGGLPEEAADEIARLRGEVERMLAELARVPELLKAAKSDAYEAMRADGDARVAAERERPRQVLAYMATSREGTVRFTDNPDAARELEDYGWAITPLADAGPNVRVRPLAPKRKDDGMGLQDLIDALAAADQEHVATLGFAEPMSYRGDYSHLAFAPAKNVTVASMLQHARSALGQTFDGYKGGEFKMDKWTDCYINNYGESGGDRIGPVLVAYLTGQAQ